MDFLIRSKILLGEGSLEILKNAKVAVFGLGGVGSYVAEALARSGVGSFLLVDNDMVDVTNINRQLIALNSTVGQYKTDVMERRMLDINPSVKIENHKVFYLEGTEVDLEGCDYVADAIDTITGKIKLAQICSLKEIRLISAMGCGNRLDSSAFKIKDIYETMNCPLCKVMRKELKKRGISKLKVVCSEEPPVSNANPPGSVAFVPSVAGLMMASEIIRDLTNI